MGELYLVATPIGNLEDITLRAIRVLKEVDLIAAEDTRHTLKLLNHLEITKPLISYHRHNEESKTKELIEQLQSGKNIAIVSDAGTPVISDPGGEIVKQAIQNKIKVIPIPGPCAFITALIASGLDATQFCFIGFLPLNKKNRIEKLEEIQQETKTILLYEAPHKLKNTLKDLQKYIKDRQIVLAKELTKIHENYQKGTAEELLEEVEEPKGEYVVIIQGASQKQKERTQENLNQLSLQQHYEYYEKQGFEQKEIIKKIAKDRKVNKNEIYQKFIKKKETY